MKVAFVVQDLMGGGVEYATAAMVRAFAAHGYAVDLLVSKVYADILAEGKTPFAIQASVRLLHMPSRRGSRNVFFLRRYLKTTDAYAVIAESGIYAKCIRLAALGLWRHPKLVQVWHGDTPRCAQGVWPRLRQRVAYWFLYSKFEALFTVNAHIREGVLSITRALRPKQIKVVYNPVIDDAFRAKVKAPATHPWLVQKTGTTLVAAGACDWNKGHLMLIQAIEKIRDRGVRLVIFGTGVKEREFREYVQLHHLEEVVSLAGFTNNLPAELKAADGFVLGTHVESFAIVLVEALACGVPVISTAAPWGPVEVLENGKYGKLVPVDDVEAMALAMIEHAKRNQTPIPEAAWKRFEEERIFERYLDGLGLSMGVECGFGYG